MIRARVVTVSDRAAAGTREDTSGPLLVSLLAQVADTDGPVVVPDDSAAISAAVLAAVAEGIDVVVTTGGTGLAPRDVTPEAVLPLLDKQIPGLAEAIRQAGAVPTAVLSRGVAGVVGHTLVVTLPGSPGGVRDGLQVLAPLLPHVVDQLRGGDH